MATASTVTVDITAKTAKFENGLKRAKKQSSTFGKSIQKAMRAGAIATATLATGLVALTSTSLRVVNQQTKMAQRLGLTQRAMAGLTLAAEQTGTTQQNLQLAMQRSTRRIAEAAQGTGEAVKALDELGLSAKDLAKLSPDKQFLKIAGAMAKVEGQSNKIRLGFKLFDSEGVGLINTLAEGEKGIEKFIAKAVELGVTMTDRQTKAITEANDEINLMKTAFVGLGNQLAARLSPAISSVAGVITKMTSKVTNAIPKWTAWAASIFGVKRALDKLTIADLTEDIKIVDKELFEAQGLYREMARVVKTYTDELGNVSIRGADAVANLKIQGENVAALTKRYNDLIRARLTLKNEGEVQDVETGGGGDGSGVVTPEAIKRLTEFDRAVANTRTPLEALQAKIAEIRTQLTTNPLWTPELAGRQSQAAVDAYLANLAQIKAATDAVVDAQKADFEAAASAVATPGEPLQSKLNEIRMNLANNPFWTKEVAGRQAKEAVDAYLEEMKRIKEENENTMKEMSEFQRASFQNMQGILSDYLFDPWDKGLKGMLHSFVEMLRKMVAEILATKILEYFFSFLGGDKSGSTSLIKPPTVGSPGPPAAIGGNRKGRQPVLVGERGSELFTPGATGAIRPIGAVQMDASTTINGGNGLDIATLIPILEENNRKVKGEILDALDRGAYA